MITPQAANWRTLVAARDGRPMRLQAYVEGIPDVICTEEPADKKEKTYSIDLDGSDDYVDCGTNTALTELQAAAVGLRGDWTIVAWLKPDNFSATQIVAGAFSAANLGYKLAINTSGKLVVTFGATSVTLDGAALTAASWNFAAAAVGGNTLTVSRGMINDTELDETYTNGTTRATRNSFTGGTSFRIGRAMAAGSLYSGRIGYVAVFRRSLTHGEMKRIKYRILDAGWGNDDSAGLWNDCIAQWTVERGAGTVLTNSKTPGTHDGTLTNGPAWQADPPFTITYRPYLSASASTGQDIEPLATKTSISGMTLQVLDTDQWLTDKLADLSGNLLRKDVRVTMGFRGLMESENQPVFAGAIQDMGYRGRAYKLVLGDNLFRGKVRQDVGNGTLASGITDADAELSATWNTSEYWWDADGTGVTGYIKIDDEIIGYPIDGIISQGFGDSAVGVDNLARGQFTTLAAAHSAGAQIREFWVIDNVHPLTIALRLLLSGAGGEVASPYDVFAEFGFVSVGNRPVRGRGLGMAPSDVAVAEIESLRDNKFSGFAFRLFIYDTITDLKDFIERELLRPLGCYLFTKSDGRLSIGCHKIPTVNDVVYEITPEQCRLEDWDNSRDDIVNYLEAEYDWNPASEDYDGQYIATDASSASAYGVEQRDATFNGVDGAYSPTTILDAWKTDIFARFKDPYRKATISCGLHEFLLEIGDAVHFTHYEIPNIDTGRRGVYDQRWQVVGRKPDFRTGRVRLTLADVS